MIPVLGALLFIFGRNFVRRIVLFDRWGKRFAIIPSFSSRIMSIISFLSFRHPLRQTHT